MLLTKREEKELLAKAKKQSKCKHKKRCVISLYGWNFLYCPDCEKEWHDEDI